MQVGNEPSDNPPPDADTGVPGAVLAADLLPLVRAIAQGETAGLTSLYDATVGKVVAVSLAVLHNVEDGEPPMLGRRVAVYGGGNTAMDAARTARRLGAGEFDARSPAETGPKEVRRLAGNFNMMAGRLDALAILEFQA